MAYNIVLPSGQQVVVFKTVAALGVSPIVFCPGKRAGEPQTKVNFQIGSIVGVFVGLTFDIESTPDNGVTWNKTGFTWDAVANPSQNFDLIPSIPHRLNCT